MRLSYYPGCSLHGTARDYDLSVKALCSSLGIELIEIPDWNCCGASSAHMTRHEIGVRLPMRNLLIAAELGNDLLVPCAACFQRLKAADKAIRQDPHYWDLEGYDPDFKILHISPFMAQEAILEKIGEQCRQRLEGMKIACYYGCLSLRNPKITDVKNFEQPRSLEKIVSAVGASAVSWSHRTECCSGSLTMARPDIARALVGDIVLAAERAGAEALVTDCPMCQANVESRQLDHGGPVHLPVFFATELVQAAISGEYPAKQQRLHLVSADVLRRAVSFSEHREATS
ncbi:MAG: heterodisulfide reductase-related iron-sulfur binding cluster [Desulfocapsaceae bacterium]|nr:heterodisulfide reductase-related iron-sulfur binding cluster [Desulfocapsaceae bacterium]